MKKIIFVALLILFAGISCRKEIGADSELIGTWFSPADDPAKEIWLKIDANGEGTCAAGVNGTPSSFPQKVKADDKSFKIGGSKFEIIVHPMAFDSATDWTGIVAENFAPGHLPVKKMKLKSGKSENWYYKKTQ